MQMWAGFGMSGRGTPLLGNGPAQAFVSLGVATLPQWEWQPSQGRLDTNAETMRLPTTDLQRLQIRKVCFAYRYVSSFSAILS